MILYCSTTRLLGDSLTLAGFASTFSSRHDVIIAEGCIAIACNSRCLRIFHWLLVSGVLSSIPLILNMNFF